MNLYRRNQSKRPATPLGNALGLPSSTVSHQVPVEASGRIDILRIDERLPLLFIDQLEL